MYRFCLKLLPLKDDEVLLVEVKSVFDRAMIHAWAENKEFNDHIPLMTKNKSSVSLPNRHLEPSFLTIHPIKIFITT